MSSTRACHPRLALALACALLAAPPADARPRARDKQFTADLGADACTFTDTGRNDYLVLEPGHELRLEGETRRGFVQLTITVTAETRVVDGAPTRVVEEVELCDGELVGVTRTFLSLCRETSDAYLFGTEEIATGADDGPGGTGSWRAGEDGARPGLAVPGRFLLGARYQVEQAPGVAMDRAENVEMHLDVVTPAGTFEDCVAVLETSPLEPGEEALLVRARGIGIVADETLRLVGWTPGVAESRP